MEFIDFNQLLKESGLKMVIVHGTPSPWSQAAKAMMEYKELEVSIAPWEIGAPNDEIVAWGNDRSGPIVQWQDEPPINKWNEILSLLERLAPQKPLVPDVPADRARMFGIANELCGPLGLGWNRRLQLFQPVMESGQAPPPVTDMSNKYGYNETDVAAAPQRIAQTLEFLHQSLAATAGPYFMGEQVSAADFYWAAFCNIMRHLPFDQCPTLPDFRPLFEATHPEVEAALSEELLAHRDHMMAEYFVVPMEF